VWILLFSIIGSLIVSGLYIFRVHVPLFEKLAFYLISIIVYQQLIIITQINLKMIQTLDKPIPFWSFRITEIFFYSVILSWLAIVLIQPLSWKRKMLMFLAGIGTLLGADSLFHFFHFVQFEKWNLFFSLIRFLACIIISCSFMRWFRSSYWHMEVS
jgi:hypothetical protein